MDFSEKIGGLKRLTDGTLACPVCHSPLKLTEEGLLCETPDCNRLYLIQDGIPITLIEEAVTPEKKDAESDNDDDSESSPLKIERQS